MKCMEAGHSEALLLDLLNSGHAVDGVERDALGDSATARAWMLERSISPTYSEWMALIETRSPVLRCFVASGHRPRWNGF